MMYGPDEKKNMTEQNGGMDAAHAEESGDRSEAVGREAREHGSGFIRSGAEEASASADGEVPIPREAYSDAGYVSSEHASVVPPVYHCKAPEAPREKKAGSRSGTHLGGVVAACLVCAILGGICGGAIAGVVSGKKTNDGSLNTPPSGNETVINKVADVPTVVTTNPVAPGAEMNAGEIYVMACRQVVAVTTEITTRNLFGFLSSAAVSGSGFVISPDGYILTNYHVIEDASEGGYDITVLSHDGTEYAASIVGYEEDNDIAVLKIDAAGLDAATIGDSDSMYVGQSVYAVGNPLGELQYTMTSGMVSAMDREISSTDSATGVVTTINMFQVDAAVNSGNSGGPAYNSRGEVIGVITAKYRETGVEGLGFAIPINDAISIAQELITNGYVTGKAYMGIHAETVTSIIAQYYNMVEGAYVYEIEAGSSAEACGLQVGDIIVALGDTEINSEAGLISAKKGYKAGESAVMRVCRSGEYVDLTIVFDEETPEEPGVQTYGQYSLQQNEGAYR